MFVCSFLIKYQWVTVEMPSRAFEPGFWEESFSRLCAWAVYHNFLSRNNLGMSGQEAMLLSQQYITCQLMYCELCWAQAASCKLRSNYLSVKEEMREVY